MKENKKYVFTGIIFGLIVLVLGLMGNPPNMGLCVVCFVRDTVGALNMHIADNFRYIRPELIGITLGAFVVALTKKDFAPKGGSAPFTRFILGVVLSIGALIFLGCPLRMVIRIAAGDLNAVVALLGFIAGIITGIWFLNKGFSLKRNYTLAKTEGYGFSAVAVFLLILLLLAPSFIAFSQEGPGSMRAPLLVALIGGLILGAIGQRKRVCFVSGARDAILFSQYQMIVVLGTLIITAMIGNIATDNFKLGFIDQPMAHSNHLWNFLGLYLVGLASVFLGGCPYRQFVLAGTGNADSAITIMGIVVGTALCHNFDLVASPEGPTANSKIAFFICLIITLSIGFTNLNRVKE